MPTLWQGGCGQPGAGRRPHACVRTSGRCSPGVGAAGTTRTGSLRAAHGLCGPWASYIPSRGLLHPAASCLLTSFRNPVDTWFVTKWPTVDEVCALPQGGDEHAGHLPAEEGESGRHRGCAQQHGVQPQRVPCGGVHRRHPGTGPGWVDLGPLLSHRSQSLRPGPASLPPSQGSHTLPLYLSSRACWAGLVCRDIDLCLGLR